MRVPMGWGWSPEHRKGRNTKISQKVGYFEELSERIILDSLPTARSPSSSPDAAPTTQDGSQVQLPSTRAMPPKIWMPNFPLRLKLKAPPKVMSRIEMPQPGTEGVFKTRELVFETVPQMTKTEMTRFLRAVYGIDVNRIHSLNVMGKRRGDMSEMPRHQKDYKRFYVKLNDEVELPNIPKQLDEVKKAAKRET